MSRQAVIRVMFAVSRLQRGGLEQVLLEIVRGLSPRGFAFEVMALTGPGDRDDEFRQAGARVHPLGGRSSLSLGAAVANAGCMAELVRHVRRWRPHLLQTHHFLSGVLGRLAGAVCRVPGLLQSEHNFYFWKGVAARAVDRALSWVTSRYVVPSASVAGHLTRTLGCPAGAIEVIPNGLARSPEVLDRAGARQRLGLEGSDTVIGFVGRLVPTKGPDLFIRAAADVARSRPRTEFAMLGSGPMEADCRRLARELGLSERLLLLGSVPDAALLMKAFDLVASCSSEEGFGLAMAEALLAGVPVVVPDLPAFRELLGSRPAGGFVRLGDVSGLARAMAGVLEAREAAGTAAVAEGEELLSRLGTCRMLDAYERVYRELAGQN